MPPGAGRPHSPRPSARDGPAPGAFCVPHSCRPLPPALFWSLRALFPAPSVGSLLPPRGLSLKPAMSTVQAAGRSGEGGPGRGGDGGGGGEGPFSFLRNPAHFTKPGPRGFFCFSLRLQENQVEGLADRIMNDLESGDRGPPRPCRALTDQAPGDGPQRPLPDPRPCPLLSVCEWSFACPQPERCPGVTKFTALVKGPKSTRWRISERNPFCQSEYLSLTSGRGWKFSPERCSVVTEDRAGPKEQASS